MSDWPEVELGDHIDILAGFAFKSAQFSDDPDDGVRLLRGDNVAQGALRWNGAKHWSAAEYDDFARYHLCENDVILAMDRPWIEAGLKYAYVRPFDLPSLLVQRVCRMRGLTSLDTTFLRHLIGSEAFTGHVKGIITGVNVPHISGRDIKRFRFKLPPLDTQRRIAAILGAYDDLIEVNRRRVAVLEEMARGLFEEWFVRFRFPGHENVPIIDTPDGPLPEGWTFGPCTDVVDVLSGGTPKKGNPEFWDGAIPFFTPRDAPGSAWSMDTLATVTPEGVAKCNSKLYPARTVFITARGTVGKVALAAEPMAMNQSCYALVGREYPQFFVFGFAQFAAARLRAMSNGAVFDTIIVDTFRKLHLATPPVWLASAYNESVAPLLELSRTIGLSIKHLAAARDLLLPRLISGQLSVEAAERDLELAA